VCLLIVLSRTHPETPLVVGANRDERLDRPAIPMTVLRESSPRILGGRDELAGGTWLAVNEAGVVAGLTNRPSASGRDPSKRSRGELPLLLAEHTNAVDAVDAFAATVAPGDYNPAWLLVGDRRHLFSVDVSGPRPTVTSLDPGVHILENEPPGSASPKVMRVRSLLDGAGDLPAEEVFGRLCAVLGDHEVPAGLADWDGGADLGREIPPAVKAACVHSQQYGTRWSCVVAVPDGPGPPVVRYADGPGCTTSYADASRWWETVESS
jgi:uncharacterized protein with NRDE domain